MSSQIRITQVKSAIGYTKKQKATLQALGVTKLHKAITHRANPPILGMIERVKHLLKIELNV